MGQGAVNDNDSEHDQLAATHRNLMRLREELSASIRRDQRKVFAWTLLERILYGIAGYGYLYVAVFIVRTAWAAAR